MREMEMHSRDKKVLKKTRDGLMERNVTQGTEENISGRDPDMQLGKEKEEKTVFQAGHGQEREAGRGGRTGANRRDGAHGQQKENIRRSSARKAYREGQEAREKEAGQGEQPRMEQSGQSRMDQTERTQPDIRQSNTQPRDDPYHNTGENRMERADSTGGSRMESTDGKNRTYSPNRENSVKQHENTETGRTQADGMSNGNHSKRAYNGTYSGTSHTETMGNDKNKQSGYSHSRADGTGRTDFRTDSGENANSRTDRSSRSASASGQASSANQASEASKASSEKQKKNAYQRSYEKAAKRAKKAEKDLKKAQERLPKRKRLRMEAQQDGKTGQVRHRLKFETEVIPENEKPTLAKRAAEHTGNAISHAARGRFHQKMHEVERDNVAVEAAHKAETKAEQAAVRFAHHQKRRMREKPYRDVRAAQKRVSKLNAEAEYRKLVAETPELQKNTYKKWIQKQRIKRKYAAAYREAAKGARMTGNVWNAKGQIVRKLLEKAGTRKSLAILLIILLLVLFMAGTIIFAMGAVTGGIQSAVLFTCYTAEDEDINAVELWYTEKEAELKVDIDDTEMNHRGYDEYFYNIAEIGHNPYELLGYLSAVYEDFTFEQVKPELERFFSLQYRLTRTEHSETRVWTDEEGEEHEYEWESLTTTLTVKPLSEIIMDSLTLGDQTEMYGIYMETCGNRQYFGNPFDFSWIPYVTSSYGYRENPATTSKELHRGIDIGVAEGTPIRAILDGWVVSVRDDGDMGLCVVVEDDNGFQYKYAHCATVSVERWTEVKKGDIIATVGDTGECDYPHLHMEVKKDGEYLNPYFFVENGDYGFLVNGGAQRPEYSANPGAPIGDATFAVMLEEAEKYLGCPYVWGGSSPATSFDCSGYVSWVINESGAGNVGRQTAQGLFNLCTPIAREDMQPGDLIFFTGTYSSATPVSHVGIYVGGDYMIHCGDPISYANISGNYWVSHFYSGGRLP